MKETKYQIPAIWAPLLLTVLMLVTGCYSFHGQVECNTEPFLLENFRVSFHPEFPQRVPRRVLLLNSGFATNDNETIDLFAKSLADKLKGEGLFEVMTPAVQCHTTIDEILAGRFNEAEIIGLARQYNADGIMLFRINSFKFHSPMAVNASVGLVDPDETIVMFAADGVWDLTDESTSQNYTAYIRSQMRDEHSSMYNVHRNSPRTLFGYVSSQVAKALSSRIR